jgi:DNA-binding MarR family transcriptional regulator
MSPPQPAPPLWLDESEMRFWRAFIITATLLEARLNRDLLDRHGLAHGDYVILVVLSEQPDRSMRMSALAGVTATSKSRLSHQITRMERSGLVRREVVEDDARGVLAVLTPRGLARLEEAAPTHVAGVRTYMVDLLNPEEREQATVFLERALKVLRGAEEGAGGG